MINVLNVNAYSEDSNMAQVTNSGEGIMITKQDIDDAVSEHNLSITAHPDIRETMVTSVNNVSPTSGNVSLTIPTDTNDLTNGAGFITSSALSGYALIAQDMTSLSSNGNTLSLSDNTIYKVTASGATTFSLPTITDLTKFHQIFIELNMSSVVTITLGTTYYFNKTAPDLSSAGTYNLYYEYDNTESHWVVGAIPKGSAS